ncbi:MAG: hypothetical protein J0I10_01605 [Verrucomicrobia bacterium]|nr:hypothetical protein [Verrucomicrobiota bacterium]
MAFTFWELTSFLSDFIIGQPCACRTGIMPVNELAGLLGPASAVPAMAVASATALRIGFMVFIFELLLFASELFLHWLLSFIAMSSNNP